MFGFCFFKRLTNFSISYQLFEITQSTKKVKMSEKNKKFAYDVVGHVNAKR